MPDPDRYRDRPSTPWKNGRVRLSAPAKINLGLEISGRRNDGYCEVVSVMQAISLADAVEIHSRKKSESESPRDKPFGVDGALELAQLAVDRLSEANDQRLRFDVTLEKSIPVAAGLGGGSSDAAIALLGAQYIAGRPPATTQLQGIAAELGSDISFFLFGGTALVVGRGEIISRVLPAPDAWIVLANPGVRLSTADVYAELRDDEFTSGECTCRLADSLAAQVPDWTLMVNTLQAPALRLCPQIGPILSLLREHTSRFQVAGSGPTCFGLFETRPDANLAAESISSSGFWTWVGRPRGPWAAAELITNGDLHGDR